MDTTKKQIIELAGKLFAQYGIRSVSIDDVCKKLGISKKTFYVYFEQKKDLVVDVLRLYTEEKIRKLDNHAKNANAIDNLLYFMQHQRKHQDLYPALVYDLQKYYSDVLDQNRSLYERDMQKIFAKNMRQGIAEGFYRKEINVELLCILFCSQHTTEIIVSMKQNINDENPQSVLEFFIDMVAHYMMTPAGWDYLHEKCGNPKNAAPDDQKEQNT